MRTFVLTKQHVVLSTETIAEGVQFEGGMVALHWLSPTPSVSIYRSVEEMLHDYSHDGATAIEFRS